MATRPISEIAKEIKEKWPTISLYARPYLNAMLKLESINDMYLYESADSIILYFLNNAEYWRGEDARRIKAELNSLIKTKK